MTSISDALGATVEAGELPGVVATVWRDGREIEGACVGWRDVAARTPMTRDAIFRIASMTKPVTTVAALMLMEEGRFALEDPITTVAPEFADVRVLASPAAAIDDTVPSERPITFENLLTHRSGLTYGDFHPGPIAETFRATLGADLDSTLTPDAWIAALASLPLIDQPGTAWRYGHSTDLLGQLIARIEGEPLGKVLQRRIFGPLGMKDTGFDVPAANRPRRAVMHGFDAEGRLKPKAAPTGAVAERPADMTYESGGQGLWSTLDDYLAFARVFVGEGEVDGVRLLRPETVERMMTNQLTEAQRAAARMFGGAAFTAGGGFGQGVAVMLDPSKASAAHCGGSPGAVGWPGAYGGWWTADPTDGSVMIMLTQVSAELEQMMQGFGLAVYATRETFHDLAASALRRA